MLLTLVSRAISPHRIPLHLFCEKGAPIGSICRLRTPVERPTGKQANITASEFLSMVTPRFNRCKSKLQSLRSIISPHALKHWLIDLSVRQQTYPVKHLANGPRQHLCLFQHPLCRQGGALLPCGRLEQFNWSMLNLYCFGSGNTIRRRIERLFVRFCTAPHRQITLECVA